jgi:hypothetical protein
MSKSLQERLNSLERKYRSLCCKANSETPSAPAYKVFTALLAQSGNRGDRDTICDGELIVGVTYYINNNVNGDFTNVGAPNNTNGTYFIATGTTPNSWGLSALCDTLTFVPDAPVVTVLENTIGNVWFTYEVTGSYGINSNGLFIPNKTYADFKVVFGSQWDRNIWENYEESNFPNTLLIKNYSLDTGAPIDGIDGARIEIRVYN